MLIAVFWQVPKLSRRYCVAATHGFICIICDYATIYPYHGWLPFHHSVADGCPFARHRDLPRRAVHALRLRCNHADRLYSALLGSEDLRQLFRQIY